jgi:hypothetical protein
VVVFCADRSMKGLNTVLAEDKVVVLCAGRRIEGVFSMLAGGWKG